MAIAEQARQLAPQLEAWRRDFHQHPELGFQEVRTARVVGERLAELGIEAQSGIAKTGVVGYIGEGGPVVAIRGDMDALPILEATGAAYASQTPGIMHACGHDAHTAILLGVASVLTQMPDRPTGQIRLLFQPCEETSDEEGKSGGLRMVEEGVMEGVDAVIALHVGSDMPANTVMVQSGPVTANADRFRATIYGTGGHGAFPHQGTDPTFMLAQVINAIHGIRARKVDPTIPAVISIGTIHAGTVPNVIPSEVVMTGTIRSFDDETRALLHRELEAAFGLARALGGDYQFELQPGYPTTLNDPRVVGVMEEVTREVLGADALLEPHLMMAGEDFSYMSRQAPGAMLQLGAAPASGPRQHHTPLFDIDEGVMATGVTLLAETACRLLRQLHEESF
jgi:amidohydrolase